MAVGPAVIRRVMRELKELDKNPPEGIRIQMNEEDLLDVTGIIEGPEGTPYAGGYFKVKFQFSNTFPSSPPKCWFTTKIFHPNVGPTGEICVNTLKKDWKPDYGIGHILITVKCLLIYPNPESALDEEAGKLLLEEYEAYCDRARLITSVHAMPRVRPLEFEVVVKKKGVVVVDLWEGTGVTTTTTAPPVPSTSTSTSTVVQPPAASKLSIPSIRKSSPPSIIACLKASSEKEGTGVVVAAGMIQREKEKERHASPSPLATADSNVGNGNGKASMGVGMGMPPSSAGMGGGGVGGVGGVSGTRAVKRAATGSAPTNAEKRKKALKRL